MKKSIKKILYWGQSIKLWWMLHFRNTLMREVEFDAYIVTFRRFTMDIKTKSGNLKLRTMSMLYPNAFLYNALDKGEDGVIEWYCNEIYQFVTLISTDNGLIQDIHKAFAKYYKRIDKQAESLAKAVSEEDDKVNEEIVNMNIKYAKMTKSERKEYKSNLKKVLNEDIKNN